MEKTSLFPNLRLHHPKDIYSFHYCLTDMDMDIQGAFVTGRPPPKKKEKKKGKGSEKLIPILRRPSLASILTMSLYQY